MQNLDQIRAKNALEAGKKGFQGVNEGEVVKKVPTMIRENGILGAGAFALETGKGYQGVFEAIIAHLRVLKRVPDAPMSLADFLAHLAKADAAQLRAVTAEALAYLNYLRRFAAKNREG